MKNNTKNIQASFHLTYMLCFLSLIACIEQHGPIADPILDPLDFMVNDQFVLEDQQIPNDDQMVVDLGITSDSMVDALTIPSDQNLIPEPELCNGRDDDLDGIIDEDYIYSESSPPLTLSSSNRIEPNVAPKLLLLPNQDFFAIWNEGQEGYLPTSFGSYINEEGHPTIADRLPIHNRIAHWHNAGYEVLGVKGGAMEPIGVSIGLFDASIQETIKPWNTIRNSLLYGRPAGVWTGERHIIVSAAPFEDQLPNEQSSLINTYTIARDGELESQRTSLYPAITVSNPIASAKNDDQSIFVWGEGGQSLRLSAIDSVGNEIYSRIIQDVDYRLTGGKLNVQVEAFHQQWIIIVPVSQRRQNGGFLVIILNHDGREEQRYIVGENLIIDELSVATSDKLAIVMARYSNSDVDIWLLTTGQVIRRRTFNQRPNRFDIQAVEDKLYVLGTYLPDVNNITETIRLYSFECTRR